MGTLNQAFRYIRNYGRPLIVTCELLVWAMVGGLAVLRHSFIRWLLERSFTFPWYAQTFLDNATARILLKRVGGGYQFIHQLLLRHLADTTEQQPPPSMKAHNEPSSS